MSITSGQLLRFLGSIVIGVLLIVAYISIAAIVLLSFGCVDSLQTWVYVLLGMLFGLEIRSTYEAMA